MSYQALARTYRPKSFNDMVGQQHVLTALSNSLTQQRLHHAYLFTGTRGVGKTTLARILAKSFLCETGITPTPCGTCWTCESIDAGQFVDLIEIDAASRTKVEDTREILDNVQYAPSHGRFKVYVIDEVHMLSTHSFNALLKTLEEPPEHVKFILATTDPQKLPITVLSRCLQFNLKNMLPDQISAHLATLLKTQSIPYEEAALWHIAKAAQGSMRDGLSILDQAIAYTNLNVTEQAVKELLGTVHHQHLLELLTLICQRDASQALQITEHMNVMGADFQANLAELISLLQQIAILQAIPDAPIDDPNLQNPLAELATKISPEDTQLFYQIALLARRDFPLAPNPKRAFDMMLLRMLTFQPDLTGEKKKLKQRVAPLENSRIVKRATVEFTPQPLAEAPLDEVSAFFAEPEKKSEVIPIITPPVETKKSDIESPIQSNDDWCAWINKLNLQGMAKALAAETQWISSQGTHLELHCDPKKASLYNINSEARLLQALNDTLDVEHTIHIRIQDTDDTLAKRLKASQAADIAAAEMRLQQDPCAQAIEKNLCAALQAVSLL